MRWFRFYHEAYRNPKVQDLRPELFKFWVNTLCVANESSPRGTIASEAHLRLALGLPKALVKRWVSELEASNLLDRSSDGTLTPHDWHGFQRKSDDAAERKRIERSTASVNGHSEMSRDMSRDTSRDNGVTLLTEVEAEGDTEGEESPPLPPAIVLGPEFTSVGEWAIQIGADVSWGTWVSRQGMCGHSAANIRKAIEISAGAGKLTQSYVASKLQAWANEGGPPKRKGENNGKTAVQQQPEETRAKLTRPDLPRTPQFAGVNRYYDDMEAGRTPNPKDLAI